MWRMSTLNWRCRRTQSWWRIFTRFCLWPSIPCLTKIKIRSTASLTHWQIWWQPPKSSSLSSRLSLRLKREKAIPPKSNSKLKLRFFRGSCKRFGAVIEAQIHAMISAVNVRLRSKSDRLKSHRFSFLTRSALLSSTRSLARSRTPWPFLMRSIRTIRATMRY